MDVDEDIAIRNALIRASQWRKYQTPIEAIGYIEQTSVNMNKENKLPVPSNYVCRRCNKPGHYITKCITIGDPAFNKPQVKKGIAGIPKTFTKTITNEEAEKNTNAFIRSDGTYCLVSARTEMFQFYTESVKQAERVRIPNRLNCGLCNNLIKNPLNFPCCPMVCFCTECIIRPDELIDNIVYCPICNRDCHTKKLVKNITVEKDSISYREEQHKLIKKRVASQQLDSCRGDKLVRY